MSHALTDECLLPFSPFAPISFFRAAARCGLTILDGNENYIKQTIRNRYFILGANGVQTLSIPIMSQSGNKVATKDIKIEYRKPWRAQHLRTLKAAYGSSPYFQFYYSEIENLFNKTYPTLGTFCTHSFQLMLNTAKLNMTWRLSSKYVERAVAFDFRKRIKSYECGLEELQFKPYLQVFADRSAFVSNLCFLDLIFNLGPHAHSYITEIE